MFFRGVKYRKSQLRTGSGCPRELGSGSGEGWRTCLVSHELCSFFICTFNFDKTNTRNLKFGRTWPFFGYQLCEGEGGQERH